MILDISKLKIYVKPGPTDFRKQINGLSIIVQEEMELNPLNGNLYVFCNKSRNRIKILYWDKTGFAMWLKRLEKGKFPWPRNVEEALEIDLEKMKMLLSGIDFWNAHKELKFSKIN
jgi:transposase